MGPRAEKCVAATGLALLLLAMILPLHEIGSAAAQAERDREHVVKKGDTLWDLASTYMRDPFLWPAIWHANQDRIADPHWIYPGQRFLIPPVYEPVAEKPLEEPVEIEEPAAVEELAEMEGPAFRKEAAPQLAVARDFAHRAGFITKADLPGGFIIASETDGREDLIRHDIVYINLGSEDGTSVGNLFTIYRLSRGVRHPKTGRDLGRLVRVLGQLQVVGVQERTSAARITESYEEIHVRDRITPYRETWIPEDARPVVTDLVLDGVLVTTRDEKETIWPYDVVYIDQGTESGVVPGDIFTVRQPGGKVQDPASGRTLELPEVIVGSIQVLSVNEGTAAGYVAGISEDRQMRIGDTVRLHAKVQAAVGE
jgi:hypothetical protein